MNEYVYCVRSASEYDTTFLYARGTENCYADKNDCGLWVGKKNGSIYRPIKQPTLPIFPGTQKKRN